MSDLNVYTTSQINALTPITGDMVVDSDLNAVKLYDGSAWRKFAHDAQSFVVILRDTHANIIARTGDTVGTIAFGTDTQDLYVYDGTNWYFYQNT